MPSLRSTVLAAATIAFATFAQAKDYQIDPDSVTEDTRDRWCDDQMRICPYICEQTKPGTTEQNECWSDNLTYVCICGDGKPANVTKYTLTLPYYICQEYGNQCVAKCAYGDNACASDCREQNPCGATNPDRINATTSASGTVAPTASQTDDGTTIYTGPPGSGGDSSSSSGSGSGNGNGNGGSGAGALNSAQAFSLAVVFGTLFAGFAML